MPLEMIEIRDVVQFQRDWGTNVGVPASTSNATGAEGFAIWQAPGFLVDNVHTMPGYLHTADQMLFFNNTIIRDGTTYWKRGATRFDSQGIDTASGTYLDSWTSPTSLIGTSLARYIMGQPQLESGIQNAYGYFNTEITSGPGWGKIDPLTMTYPSTKVFPNYNPEGSVIAASNDGWYDMSNAISLSPRYQGNGIDVRNLIFFEGITDSTGYSEITDGGTNTHAEGLALQRVDDCLLSGTQINAAWIWVDVDTGNAVGYLDVPYDTFGTDGSGAGDAGQQSEPNLDGKGFNWSSVQFVPDPDSLDAQPKGELHFFSHVQDSGVYPDQAFETSGTFIDGAATAFTGYRAFVAVYDFNPFGLTTGATRTHNERVFLGSIDIPADPALPGGPTLTLTDGSNSRVCSAIFYHQPSLSYFLWNGFTQGNIAGSPIEVAPATDDWALLRWKRALVVDEIVSTPLSVVATNKTVRHQAIAFAEFSQKASGVNLNATLSRVSTYAELFTPTSSTDVYVVDADVIDDNETLEVYEGSDPATGTLLTETTNYTVVYSTGTITGVNFNLVEHSIVYQHRSAELSPAHGSLLNASASTDSNGIAFFDVAYPDDATLENQIDSITITSV